MLALCIPWLLLLLIGVSLVLLVLKKYKCAICVIVLSLFLNWIYEVLPVSIGNCQCDESEKISVLSFNIDGTSEAAIKGIKSIACLILDADADVVYLAEDHYFVCDQLDTLLKETYPYTTHTICTDYPICTDYHYFYSKYPLGDWYIIGRSVDSLNCIISSSVIINGKSIGLYGCHLSSNNYSVVTNGTHAEDIVDMHSFGAYMKNISNTSALREKEAKIIVDSICKSSNPSIVLGDMNDISGSASLRIFKNAELIDAWWNGGTGYGATFHRQLAYRIDHIIYSKKTLQLCSVKKISSKGHSDHDALYAEFHLSSEDLNL